MPKRSRQARAREFNTTSRRIIKERDRYQCIFCRMEYRMGEVKGYSPDSLTIMHYIPRSHGGLGIPQNGALGCIYHHTMLDNGNKGYRGEMLQMFKQYLQNHYPDWSEDALTYSKWK
nr:MAG TPA: 5-methylcytosine-specific restriction enzyme A [Caudoviricetes sp.]